MILLKTDTTNNRVVLTLSELVTLTGNTFFLVEMTSDDTNESVYCVPDDISINTCRYNEFEITVSGGTETLTGPTVSIDMNPVGYWKYTVYQQESPTNLDPALADGVIENGKVFLDGPVPPEVTDYKGNDDNTTNVYEG